MIQLSGSLYQTLTGSTVLVASGVELALDSGSVFIWSGTGDIIYQGNTYVGVGNLGSISQIEEDGDLAANGISMTLSGIPVEMMAIALQEEYKNRKVKVYIFIFDQNKNLLGGWKYFSGRIDMMNVSVGPSTLSITLTAENHTINLDRARIRRFTDIDQRTFVDKNDLGFEYISKISGDLEFQWGAKTLHISSRPATDDPGPLRPPKNNFRPRIGSSLR